MRSRLRMRGCPPATSKEAVGFVGRTESGQACCRCAERRQWHFRMNKLNTLRIWPS